VEGSGCGGKQGLEAAARSAGGEGDANMVPFWAPFSQRVVIGLT